MLLCSARGETPGAVGPVRRKKEEEEVGGGGGESAYKRRCKTLRGGTHQVNHATDAAEPCRSRREGSFAEAEEDT